MDRECGNCTKCCEGWLSATINGIDVGIGKPCPFVEISKGCTIYTDRPEDPCKRYLCAWMKNDDMPDEFKPEVSGTIFHWDAQGRYWCLVKAPNNPTPQLLSWAIMYAVSRKQNIVWYVDDNSWWIGDEKFCEEMSIMHEKR